MRWINNIPALKPVQLVSVNRSDCVSRWSNSDDFCLSLVGSNPRACLPVKAAQMEGRGHRRRFVFHSPFSLLSRQLWDHLPSQIKGMFVPHICLCSQTIFVIKLRLSGIFQIPGWWHWALGFFFRLVAFSRGKCSLQKLLAVLWCVCGMKWRIEWVLLMFLMPQLRADPLCAGGNSQDEEVALPYSPRHNYGTHEPRKCHHNVGCIVQSYHHSCLIFFLKNVFNNNVSLWITIKGD